MTEAIWGLAGMVVTGAFAFVVNWMRANRAEKRADNRAARADYRADFDAIVEQLKADVAEQKLQIASLQKDMKQRSHHFFLVTYKYTDRIDVVPFQNEQDHHLKSARTEIAVCI